MSRCAMQCTSALSDSCLQRCESEHEAKKKKIKIVKIPPPKDDPVPKIFYTPGVDGGGNGGGGGYRKGGSGGGGGYNRDRGGDRGGFNRDY